MMFNTLYSSTGRTPHPMNYHQTPIVQRGLVSPLMTPKTSALFAFGEIPIKTSDLEKVGNVFDMMKREAEKEQMKA
jgi:hypothetical protein